MQGSDLKSALALISKRQNLLAGVPPALRPLPVVMLACADLLQRTYGWSPARKFLPSLSPDTIKLVDSSVTTL